MSAQCKVHGVLSGLVDLPGLADSSSFGEQTSLHLLMVATRNVT